MKILKETVVMVKGYFRDLLDASVNPYEKQKKDSINFITEDSFGTIIDWNIQTSMYGMMYPIYKNINTPYLEDIANSIKNGNGVDRDLLDLCMATQREALIHAMIDKGLLTTTDIKNPTDLKLMRQEERNGTI